MVASLRKTLLDHLSLSLLLPVVRFSYGFALAAILSNHLSVENYGHWSLYISNMGLVLTFSSLNLMYSSQVVLTGQKFEQQKKDMFTVGSFKFVFTIFCYLLFALYLLHKEILATDLIALLLAGLFFRTVNDLAYGFLRALLRLKRQVAFFATESALIIGAVAASSYLFSGGLYGAVFAFIAAEIVAAAVGVWLLRDYLGWSEWNRKTLGKYLRIGLPLIPFSFSDLIVNALVPLLLKLYEGVESVAFYSIAQKVALVATVPNAIIGNVYAQYLKKSYLSDGGAGVRKTFFAFLGIYGVLAIPVLIGLFLFGEDIIRMISTEEYVKSRDLMLLLALVNVVIMVTAMLTTVFAVYDRTRLVGAIWIGILVFYVAINQWFVPHFHIMGVAYALLIAFGLGLILVALATVRLRHSQRSQSPKPGI